MTATVGPAPLSDASLTSAQGRVLHAVRRHGEVSQTFIADAIAELDALGWEAWVLSHLAPVQEPEPAFPAPGRVLRPLVPSYVRRARNRAMRRDERRCTVDWWRPAIRTARPALIHAHFGWTAARSQLRALGVPVLASFHGSDVNAWPHAAPENMRLYTALFAELERATAVSRFIEGRLRSLGYEGRIDIVPPGVRLEQFAFREPTSEGNDIRLLFVGRHVSCKGLDTLLEAMAILPGKEAARSRLEVIGNGPLRRDYERLAQRLGIERRVEFRGARPHADVALAIAAADLVVVPSRRSASGEEEGSPVVPKEALATGTPVVATDVGGMSETLPPSLRHELVPPDAPDALAHQIVRTIELRRDWLERAREGRAWIEREFDWSRIARTLSAIYTEMTPARPG